MSKKIFDFVSSFGLMVLGVFLLFIGSLSFVPPIKPGRHFPVAAPRAPSNGGDAEVKPLPASRPAVPLPKDQKIFSESLTAVSALAVDDQTNTILFAKNIEAVRPLASITKLMSALVLSELPMDWSAVAVITEDDIDPGSHLLNVGEKFTLDDLWQAALIGSSNSAVYALVRASGLTAEQFVWQMNQKAAAWHLPTLHFDEPSGLSANNVASAWDIARLLKEALKADRIYRTLQISEYYLKPLNVKKARRVWTTDWLLTDWVPNNFSADDIAGKTGYIAESGYNFAVRLVNNHGRVLRIVILGAATNEARFSEARDLAEWVTNHYVWPGEDGYGNLAE